MGKPSPPLDKQYVGRSAGVMPVTVTLDKDAVAILRQYTPTRKGHGRLLSRLLYEHAARIETRQEVLHRVQANVQDAIAESADGPSL